MRMPSFKSADAQLLAVAVVALIAVYVIGKKVLTGAANVAGGVVSGNNAVTAGTPYAGWGVPGTLGAAANSASGGLLSEFGTTVGGWAYDIFGSSAPAPATQVNSAGGGG